MRRLAVYLKYFKREVILGPFFKLLEAVFELIVPLVMASIIDVGIKYNDRAYILQRGGLILLLGFMGLLFALICQYYAAKASQGFGTKVRNDLFSHINSLSHAELDSLGTNTMITVITNDINQMQLAVAMLIRLVVRAPFLAVGAAFMAMMLDLKLSLIFILISPLVALCLFVIMTRSVPYYRRRQQALDKISLITRENLMGARVIRAFSKQRKEEERFDEANDEVTQIANRVGKISALLNPATFTIMNLAIILIIWFGGVRVDTGYLTQGEVVAFINYMTQISLALIVVANLVILFTKAGASANRINTVFDLKASMLQETEGKIQSNNSTDPYISLRKVSFAYPGSKELALEDVSIDIKQGEFIGIIGGTGSGKTTLVNLLPRFYDITSGEIMINGIPIKDYDLKALRELFGIVPQRAVLFYGSIVENMRLKKADAKMEEVIKAIKISQAEEFVEKLPNCYDTLIMQGGKNLSGGQRQRLTIARALIGEPKILVLDDSTSALDYATDARLRKELRRSLKDIIMIMVSQRAHAIKEADQIIVLDDGKLVGSGKHKELLRECEVYREICLSQLSSEEVDL